MSEENKDGLPKAENTEGSVSKPEEVKAPAEAAPVQASTEADAEKEAKAKAAAEARAARAAARAAAQKGEESEAPAEPKPPSPKQPLLDQMVDVLRTTFGENAVLESFINEKDDHLPCVVLQTDLIAKAGEVLRDHPVLKLTYLRNMAGSDLETHMEVIYHIVSIDDVQEYCLKVKADRNQPSVPSVTSVWNAANWNEREIYDLFGIDFPGHPDLRRIMMSDDWVGHPMRKDYEPLDPEV